MLSSNGCRKTAVLCGKITVYLVYKRKDSDMTDYDLMCRQLKSLLGPFQGKPACTVIDVGKGVCGTAVAEDKTQLVRNVHEFPGHIACDSASNSEIVVPVHSGDSVYGVLDIDSPQLGRFSEKDKEGLEAFVRILESAAAIK